MWKWKTSHLLAVQPWAAPLASLGLRFLAVQWRCSQPSASWGYCVRGRTVREGPLVLFKGEPPGEIWSRRPESVPSWLVTGTQVPPPL